MKKRIFALALALCMMVSVMPTSFANGVLTLGDGTGTGSTGVLTLDNSTSGRSTTSTSGSAQPRQDGVLYNTSSVDLPDDGTVNVGGENSGTLNGGSGSATTGDILGGGSSSTGGTTGGSTAADLVTNTQGLELSKIVSGNKITLEAFVTGQTVTTETTSIDSMDIILVLDRSSYMVGQMDTLVNSVNDFIDAVYDEYAATNGTSNGRIAIVSYADQSGTNGTMIHTGTGSATEQALLPICVEDDDGNIQLNGALSAAVTDFNNDFTADSTGDAYSDVALGQAARIFQSVTGTHANDDRIVVLFTAGIPGVVSDEGWTYNSGSYTRPDYPAYDVAQASIHWGVILKGSRTAPVSLDYQQAFYQNSSRTDSSVFNGAAYGCDAAVYCVGINLDEYGGSRSSGSRINEYLYRLSSHRDDGSHVGDSGTNLLGWPYDNRIIKNNWEREHAYWTYDYPDIYTRGNVTGTRVTGTKYYQTGALGNVGDMFEEITGSITTGGASLSTLTSSTIVQDVISPYFQIPTGGTVTAHTETYKGTVGSNRTWAVESDDTSWTLKPVGNTVQATGFDFTANYVGDDTNGNTTTSHGKKLVIEIDIAPNSDFLGGNGVATNDDAQAGVFLNQELIENFPNDGATTRVEVSKIDPAVVPQNIYLSNSAALQALLSTTQDARINGTNNKYVDITYTIYEGTDTTSENKVGTYTIAKGGTVNSGTWNPASDNAIWTPVLEADATYTVVCTVDGGGDNKKDSAKTTDVSVFKPEITFEDSTIYLGVVPTYLGTNYTADDIAWLNGKTDAKNVTMRDTAPEATITFDPATAMFTECTPVNVTAVALGNGEDKYAADLSDVTFVNGTSHSGDEDADEFTVHVVKPVFTNTDTTIYLGNTTNLNNRMKQGENWVCGHAGEEQETLPADKVPSAITIDHIFSIGSSEVGNETAAKPADCTTYTVVTKVAGNIVEALDNSVEVHVLKPSLSVEDAYIYQGQSQDLVACVSIADTWTGCETAGQPEGVKPEDSDFSFTFEDIAGTSVKPETCLPVTVAEATVKGQDVMSYFDKRDYDFTVHVLKPHFTVTTTDLWADYGTNVDLYMGGENYSAIDAVTGVSHTWVYTGSCSGDGVHPEKLPADAPTITLNEVTFVEGATYEVGTTDGMVTVNSVKYTSSAAGDKETDTDLVVTKDGEETKSVIIHVNKFDLTINKTWDGAEIYQQDAIFTVAHGQDTFKVVLPAGDTDVTISNLLCGQTYTVTEDDNWTWRWNSDGVKTVDAETTAHTVSASDPHGEETDHIEEVSFINSLAKRLWLSFCTFVQNIFGQAAIQKGGN